MTLCGLLALVGCSGSDGGSGASNVSLEFVTAPTSGLAGLPFDSPITLRVVRPDGSLVTDELGAVWVRLVDPAGVSFLGGATAVPIIMGVATFPDLVVERGGRDLVLVAESFGVRPTRSAPFTRDAYESKRHVIVMIADGWGYKQIEATRNYTGRQPPYSQFQNVAMSTGDTSTAAANGGAVYDPTKFWSDFGYALVAPTDSASSATAMYTGRKTDTGRIGVGPGSRPERLLGIPELALKNGLGSGAVSSVPISHATPAAWIAHNASRGNYHVIADEALFGDPKVTTGGTGAFGVSPLRQHVLIGGGNPAANTSYLTASQVDKARKSASNPSGWTVVQRDEQNPTGPAALLAAARDPNTSRLLGLFGGAGGNIAYRFPRGDGADPRDATLAEMTTAALAVLERRPKGFFLMIEGGAVDWAGHMNRLDACVGEMIGFDAAVQTVIAWIEDPDNGSSWKNTLLIVTGDHETGLLSAGPGVRTDQALGEVSDQTLAAERVPASGGYRASWNDEDLDGEIDSGEAVHWSWNSGGHSNSLIPCYFRGVASELLRNAAKATDSVRGAYLDNTDLAPVMLYVLGYEWYTRGP